MASNTARRRFAWSLAAVVAIALAASPLVGPNLQNGDSAVYNQQVDHHRLDIRTTHVGYIALGIAFHAVAPWRTDTAMNAMCVLLGALGALAVGWLALALGASAWLAVLAGALALSSHAFFRGMVLSEVDSVLAALAAIALALYAWRRPALAGAAFGLAMLTSPLGAWSLPWFVFCRTAPPGTTRARWTDHARQLVVFGLVSLAVYVPVVAMNWHDYVYGGRGIVHAPRQPLQPLIGLGRSAHLFAAGLPIIPLMAAGVALALARRRDPLPRSLALGVLVSLVAAALFGERFLDVPVQLPNWLVLSAYAALVGTWAGSSRRWVVVPLAALCITAFPAVGRIAREVHHDRRDRAVWLAMAHASAPRPILLIGLKDPWDDGERFDRIVYDRASLGRGQTWPSFRRAIGRVAREPKSFDIWLLRPEARHALGPLLSRYRVVHRTVRGQSYEVLTPR